MAADQTATAAPRTSAGTVTVDSTESVAESVAEVGDEGGVGELPVGLRMVIARLNRMLRQTRAGAELSPTQYQVLATIVRTGPVRLSDLAADEGLNPTMLSRIAGKLEAAGLVLRTADATDGRVSHLAAADPGLRLVERVRAERTDALSRALHSLSDHDRRALMAALPVLETLAEALRDTRP